MFYDRYAQFCSQKNVKPSRAAEEAGVSKSAVTNWKNTGSRPNTENALKLATYFGISLSELFGDENEETPALTKKDERDIAKDLELLRANLESGDTLMFDGDPMTEEAKESILAAMKLGLEAAKAKNKRVYGRKKKGVE